MCERTASDWSAAQPKDDTARTAADFTLACVAVMDITNEVIPRTVDKLELKILVSQGELMELPNYRKLLVKRLFKEPTRRSDVISERFERLLGEDLVRTYVSMLLRPWVMDSTRKESVHLGKNVAVTLSLLLRYYWWIRVADSLKWWITRCYT